MNTKAFTILFIALVASTGFADQVTNAPILSEQNLLAAFPQLSWSRAQLEFIFEKRAEMSLALTAGASSDDEAVKLAKQMEAQFKSSAEIKTFTEGWKMVGRLHSEDVHFSKPGCILAGMTGETELLFCRTKLTSFCFWVDSDKDSRALNGMLVRACGAPGVLAIRGKDASEFTWKVSGTNQYAITLERDSSNPTEVVRGVTIFIKHPAL